MPEVPVNSTNILEFKFSASFDLYNKRVIFSSAETTYVSGGQLLVTGICFQVVDGSGVVVHDFDFTMPDIQPAIGQNSYQLDLSAFGFPFVLGNTFKITGAIKDSTGQIYYTTPVYIKICKPLSITETGFVPGMFVVTANCPDNILTAKELTLLVYNGKTPSDVAKTGVLYYPTGTISPVSFSGTPFTNNEIYTGENRVACTTVATYDMGDDIFVLVTYITDQVFKVICGNKMMSLMCCVEELQRTAIKECNNAKGVAAKELINQISFSFFIGLGKEINGEDASFEYEYIRKTLNCNCGSSVLGQNEETPINPAVTTLVLQGVGGTTIPDATINGNTKTYQIASNIYQVVKGVPGDLAFSITTDTSSQNLVKYKITFNYAAMAASILTAIQNDPNLVNQLNSLITSISPVISGLNGKCIVDLTKADYALNETVTANTLISIIVINGTPYNAPTNLHGNDATSINTWLNSLSLGTFNAVVVSGVLTIISVQNPNIISTMTFVSPNETKQFGSTSKTLVQVLQAIIDYLCALTACQVALCNNLVFYLFDYNGNLITTALTTNNKQDDFNTTVQNVINNLAQQIATLTGITCDKLMAVFVDRPASSFVGNARVYGKDDNGNCIGFTPQQLGLGVMQSAQSFQNVKDAFCAIDCSSPANCPDISGINMSILTGNIAIYGVTFGSVANASQQLTVRYRVSGTTTWIVATNSLGVFANGNVQSNPPFLITGLSVGTTYDVWIMNNCGGNGFTANITTPTGTVFSGNFLLDSALYSICGQSPVTLYSASPFASGVTMFSDIGLTTPITGFLFIAQSGTGNIFQLNSSTGVVGSDTGSSCTNGLAGSYILGNSTGTICTGSPTTRYTNGPFNVGGILYQDSALTTPVTGFSYVVNQANNHIYNLNSSTGTIGADTAIACTTKNVFVINSSGGPISITTNLGTQSFGGGVNGNIGVIPGGFVQNNMGSHQFKFIQSMPSMLDPDESPNPDTLGAGGIHNLNASIVNLNYIIVT